MLQSSLKLARRSVAFFNTRTKIMSTSTNIGDMRKSYKTDDHDSVLDISSLVVKEPIGTFAIWFQEACKLKGRLEPNAMSLATVSSDGRPSVRTVLLKGYDQEGFLFFTDYSGRKGRELEQNAHAALLFYWTHFEGDKCIMSRQVRVEGRVEKTPVQVSEEYFASRPYLSRISASVSHQSTIIPDRQVLQERVKEMEAQYPNTVPKPERWGGYLVRPEVVEFWQGQDNRLHDRIVFRRQQPGEVIDPALTHQGDNGWLIERLSP